MAKSPGGPLTSKMTCVGWRRGRAGALTKRQAVSSAALSERNAEIYRLKYRYVGTRHAEADG